MALSEPGLASITRRAATQTTRLTITPSSTEGWKYAGSQRIEFALSISPIDYSILFGGTASVGDTIQYFVVAQDSFAPPNVGCNSGSLPHNHRVWL
jgi:hypothetical protein